MLTQIKHYQLQDKITRIKLPFGAEILSFGIYRPIHKTIPEHVMMFVRLPVESKGLEERIFMIFHTSALLPATDCHFLGTVQLPNGTVQHIFEGVV